MTKEDLNDVKVGDILTNKMPINNPDHVIPASGTDYEVIEITKKDITLKTLISDASAYIYKILINQIDKCNNLRKK